MSNISAEQHINFDKKMAILTDRLLLQDCHQEAVDAIKYEGAAATQSAFETLGRVAAVGLMSDPSATKALAGFANYIDKDKYVALAAEANKAAQPSK